MSKLVCLVKEITEGVNRLEVGHICPDKCKPSPYPYTISMSCELEEIGVDVCQDNGVPKYEVDVNVSIDPESGQPSFSLASGLIEKSKATIEADPKYDAYVDEKRAKEYAKEVDGLNFKLVEMLADAVLTDKIVIDGPEAKALAQSIKDKKQAIKDAIK